MIELYNMDCEQYLRDCQGDIFDLCVTSPPYDNLRDYGHGFNGLDWKPIIKELYGVIKPGGVVVWIVADATIDGSETGTSFSQALYAMDCGFRLHDTMIWNKGCFSAVGALQTRYAPVFEYMFVFSKGKPKTFNPIKDKKNKWAGDTRHHVFNRQKSGETTKSKGYTLSDYGQRYNIWDIPPHRQRGENKHPAPFPVDIAEDHIVSWSNEGDSVLDIFMGSGTTGVACHKLKRKFTGIELDEDYFKAAKERIERETRQIAMF